MDKKQLRALCAERRDEFAPKWHDQSLFPFLNDHFGAGYWQGRVVSSFIKFRAEINLRPSELDAMHHGAQIAYPRVVAGGQPLQFHLYNDGDELITEKYGTRAPRPDAPLVVPDMLWVPLLGFDAQKYRLGYGGGFYDRTIAKLRAVKPIITIGVAFSVQYCDSTLPESHDEQLDYIVTEQGLRK